MMAALFQIRAVSFYKKFFSATFYPVWLVGIWTYKNVDEKERPLSWMETKKSMKTDKNGSCVNLPYSDCASNLHIFAAQQAKRNCGRSKIVRC